MRARRSFARYVRGSHAKVNMIAQVWNQTHARWSPNSRLTTHLSPLRSPRELFFENEIDGEHKEYKSDKMIEPERFALEKNE